MERELIADRAINLLRVVLSVVYIASFSQEFPVTPIQYVTVLYYPPFSLSIDYSCRIIKGENFIKMSGACRT